MSGGGLSAKALAVVSALALCSAARGADLHARAAVAADPFLPARPVGVASELPRSPLADAVVFGTERFDDPAQARAHCRRDIVVRVMPWDNRLAAVGSASGQGDYMCRSSALSEGDDPR